MTDTAPSINPPDWRQQGVGANWQHQFFHWLIRIGGRTRAYHIAYIVTFWYVLFYPSIRKRCRFYLDRRFPERRGFFQHHRLSEITVQEVDRYKISKGLERQELEARLASWVNEDGEKRGPRPPRLPMRPWS